jgi:fibronectin type 3 domain-containing protein
LIIYAVARMKNFFISTAILFLSLYLTGCGAGSSADPRVTDLTVNSGSSGIGVVTLSWTPPTENSDGTYLSDLKGYRIYYGYAAGEIVNLLCDSDEVGAGLTEYTVDGLDTGTKYYFAMTAVNNAGVESAMSNVVSKEP